MQLLSVNVGQPREVEWRGRQVLTSIWKSEVPDRSWVSRLNVSGDAQADLAAHGGEHRAVYVYDVSAYRHWERAGTRRRRRSVAPRRGARCPRR
jgi:MOSC domain-containing protein YiiM